MAVLLLVALLLAAAVLRLLLRMARSALDEVPVLHFIPTELNSEPRQ
jgi:hypothetical protein